MARNIFDVRKEVYSEFMQTAGAIRHAAAWEKTITLRVDLIDAKVKKESDKIQRALSMARAEMETKVEAKVKDPVKLDLMLVEETKKLYNNYIGKDAENYRKGTAELKTLAKKLKISV
jgi:hypothetical protein